MLNIILCSVSLLRTGDFYSHEDPSAQYYDQSYDPSMMYMSSQQHAFPMSQQSQQQRGLYPTSMVSFYLKCAALVCLIL